VRGQEHIGFVGLALEAYRAERQSGGDRLESHFGDGDADHAQGLANTLRQGVGPCSNWRLLVDYLTRTGEVMPEEGVPFTAIVTISDPDSEQPVFNDMRQNRRRSVRRSPIFERLLGLRHASDLTRGWFGGKTARLVEPFLSKRGARRADAAARGARDRSSDGDGRAGANTGSLLPICLRC
jgi:hypothetical protein